MYSYVAIMRLKAVVSLIYFAFVGGPRGPSIAISLSVCSSVRSHITKFYVHIVCGRGSTLLSRLCDTLCTSSFMNDVMFSHNGASFV